MQPQIFLSYSWNNTDIADEIDEAWKKIGLTFVRDVRDLSFKENLNQFMRRVHDSDYVVLLISKAYLESKNCMYEAMEVFDNPDFARKILPILTEDAHIGDTLTRLSYIEAWQAKAKVLEKALKRTTVSPAITASIAEDLRQVTKIANSFDDFADAIRKIIYASWPDIKKTSYKAIFKHIGYDPSETAVLEECSRIIDMADAEDQENALAALQAEHPENVYVLFLDSTIAFGERKYKKTRRMLEKLLALHPAYELANFNYGVLLEQQFEDYEGARQAFERIIEGKATSSVAGAAHRALGLLQQDQFKDYSAARTHFEQALVINPQDATAHHALALLLSRDLKEYELASEHFRQAIAIDPQHNYHYNFALLLGMELKDFAAAKEHYERAIALDPAHSSSHNNLAIVLRNHFNDHDRSRYHLERAIEADPTHGEAHLNLATSLEEESQDYIGARHYYEAALRLMPTHARAHAYYAGLLDVQFGEYDLARTHYRRAVELAPEHIAIRQRLATLLQKRFGDYDGALHHFEQILVSMPTSANAHYNLAVTFNKLVNFDTARHHYEQALAINNEHVDSYIGLGEILSKHYKDYASAHSLYEQALEILPNNSSLHHLLGFSLRKHSDDYVLARYHLERALELKPTWAPNYYNLAILLCEHFDEPALARQYFEQGIQVAPDDPAAHINLGFFLLNEDDVANAQTQYTRACELNAGYKTAANDEIFGV